MKPAHCTWFWSARNCEFASECRASVPIRNYFLRSLLHIKLQWLVFYLNSWIGYCSNCSLTKWVVQYRKSKHHFNIIFTCCEVFLFAITQKMFNSCLACTIVSINYSKVIKVISYMAVMLHLVKHKILKNKHKEAKWFNTTPLLHCKG